jgi:hypothetical protein
MLHDETLIAFPYLREAIISITAIKNDYESGSHSML